MALIFPSNPVNGQVYTDGVSGLKYVFNNSIGAWESAIQPHAIVSASQPNTAIKGKIWFDIATNSIKVYDGSTWAKPVSSAGALVSTTPPTQRLDSSPLVTGDLWWNSEDGLFYIYYVDVDTSQWVVATPTPNMTQMAAGNVTSPGIAVIGDSNTGLYAPGPDALSVTLGGSAKLAITTSAITTAIPFTSSDDLTGLSLRTSSNGTVSDVAIGPNNANGLYLSNTNEVSFATNSNQRLIIGSAGEISTVGTGSFKIPVGTTGQRPTGASGKIRFNSTLNKYEGYNGSTSAWMPIGGSGVTVSASAPVSPPPVDGDLWFDNTAQTGGLYVYQSASWVRMTYNTSLLNSVSILDNISSSFNGVTTVFNLLSGANPIQLSSGYEVIVSLDGVFQEAGYAFNIDINNKQIVFTEAPATGVRCQLIYIAQVIQIGTPSDNTVTTPKLVNLSVTSSKVAAKSILNSKIGWDGLSFDDRNFIMNGDFSRWVRGSGTITAPSGAVTYGPDRWFASNTGSSCTMAKQPFFAPIGGSSFWPATKFDNGSYCRVAVTSVAGSGNLSTFGQDMLGMEALVNGQATISFWAKADGNKSIGVELVQAWNGSNDVGNTTYITPQTINLTSTWQQFTLTFTIPNIGGKTYGSYTTRGSEPRLAILFWLDCGTTYASRSGGIPQQSIVFDVANVQVEAGDTASPFTLTPPNIETIRCSYFYQRSYTSYFQAWLSNQRQGSSDWTSGGGYNTAVSSMLVRFFVNDIWNYPLRTTFNSDNTCAMSCKTSSGTRIDYFKWFFLNPFTGASRALSFTYRWKTVDDPYTMDVTQQGTNNYSQFCGFGTLSTGGNPAAFGNVGSADNFPNSIFGASGIILLHCDNSWNQIASSYVECNAELR